MPVSQTLDYGVKRRNVSAVTKKNYPKTPIVPCQNVLRSNCTAALHCFIYGTSCHPSPVKLQRHSHEREPTPGGGSLRVGVVFRGFTPRFHPTHKLFFHVSCSTFPRKSEAVDIFSFVALNAASRAASPPPSLSTLPGRERRALGRFRVRAWRVVGYHPEQRDQPSAIGRGRGRK